MGTCCRALRGRCTTSSGCQKSPGFDRSNDPLAPAPAPPRRQPFRPGARGALDLLGHLSWAGGDAAGHGAATRVQRRGWGTLLAPPVPWAGLRVTQVPPSRRKGGDRGSRVPVLSPSQPPQSQPVISRAVVAAGTGLAARMRRTGAFQGREAKGVGATLARGGTLRLWRGSCPLCPQRRPGREWGLHGSHGEGLGRASLFGSGAAPRNKAWRSRRCSRGLFSS